MGFFDKLKKINIFANFGSELTDDFYDELEESLILADTGMDTTLELVEELRRRVKEEKIKDMDSARACLRRVLTEMLQVGEPELHLTTIPSVALFIGVNGVGKTTTIGKLSAKMKGEGKKVLMAAADTFRAAAADQLEIWSQRSGVEIVRQHEGADPAAVVYDALTAAKARGTDVILIDTAGRLHVDEELMEQLKDMKAAINPTEILLIVDAMIGQDAVNAAKAFDEALDITGVMLTKLDGDARGGAALSIKAVTGKPIKFVGQGEKLDQVDVFYPDRMASRILGMGDILSLIEKIQSTTDLAKALEMEKKLRKDEFTLEQFLEQMQQVKKLGSLDTILGLIPGMGGISQKLKEANVDEKEFDRVEAIIRSMTPKERRHPDIINGSRRKRIAAGCGMRVQDVNKLLKNFEESKKMMKKMQGMAKFASKGGFKMPFMNK